MNRYHSYLYTTLQLINSYPAGTPLPFHLKTFFLKDKKYGSRDRKMISSCCYAYFRSYHLTKGWPEDERVLAGIFLQDQQSNPLLQSVRPEWDARITDPLPEKLLYLNKKPVELFPFDSYVMGLKDRQSFVLSLLQQPDLFIRVRPGKAAIVENKLTEAAIPFTKIPPHAIRMANGAPVDRCLQLNAEAVIQDLSSQQVLQCLPELKPHAGVWDCCAASGGKSILLYDCVRHPVKLTVSDIRESILEQLRKRLRESGINVQRIFKADLSMPNPLPADTIFDLLLCDVPCTGSGTWARTPEQSAGFKVSMISDFVMLQKKIVENSLPNLVNGGLLCYITCSVFSDENEGNVAWFQKTHSLTLLHQEYIEGSSQRADTMFVALLKK
jgi:16S rRNA (cytosine967-C5)-methyltransferase